MAVNIAAAGHDLVVCDLDESRTAILAQRGAAVAATPKELAEEADYVLACLPSLAAAACSRPLRRRSRRWK